MMGPRITAARKAKGYSQTQLAEKLGTRQSTVSSWEVGDRKPSRKMREKLSEELGIAPEVLEFGERNADEYEAEPKKVKSKTQVKIAGYVGGAKAFTPFEDEVGELVDLPPGCPEDVTAVRVWGDSMAPYYPSGTTLFYSEKETNIAAYIGEVVICGLVGGGLVYKTLAPGSAPGLYNLLSANDEHILDVVVEFIHPVIWTNRF